MIFFKIDLDEVRKHFGIDYEERGLHHCLLCGKEIENYGKGKTKMVHLTTDGYLVPTDIDVENSQGLFPVGPGCAKKLKSLVAITT